MYIVNWLYVGDTHSSVLDVLFVINVSDSNCRDVLDVSLVIMYLIVIAVIYR